jgi:hypothetical protein
MIRLKYYLIAVGDAIFLQIVHDWQWFDDTAKRCSIVIGILIGVITVIKGVQDFLKNRLDRKMKALDLKRKEEEVRRFFESKYGGK